MPALVEPHAAQPQEPARGLGAVAHRLAEQQRPLDLGARRELDDAAERLEVELRRTRGGACGRRRGVASAGTANIPRVSFRIGRPSRPVKLTRQSHWTVPVLWA